MPGERLSRLLSSPRVTGLSVLLACLLSLPALRIGLVADDYWHRAMLRGDLRWVPRASGPFDLFTFTSGTPEESARLIEQGLAPWWSIPGVRLSFFRPLASLTHALDYTLWPTWPVVMHAESIAWYAIVVLLAARLFRRWLDPISPLAAGIATLFYAIDNTHGLPVGWIANRNALITAAFALGALLLQDIGARRDGASVVPYASAACLGLALCAGEGAVATLPYLAGHAWLIDERKPLARVKATIPSIAVVLVWMIAYRVGHHGVTGSGVYHDPLHSPVAFIRGFSAHVPLLLGAELGAPSPDSYPVVPAAGKAAFVAVAVVFVLWASVVLARLLRSTDERVRRTSRFLAGAAVLAVLPSTATFPAGRLLLLPGLGLVALVALACTAVTERAPWVAGSQDRIMRAYAAWTWLGHAVLAPVGFLLSLHGPAIIDAGIHRLAAGIPADGSASSKRLVLVNAPDTSFGYYTVIAHLEAGRSPPTRVVTMTGNLRDVRVSRTGERSFVVHEEGGFYRSGAELLFRELEPPFPTGTIVSLSDVRITVTHATADGIPDEASFVFANDLESGYCFREWKGSSMVPFTFPPIGETVTFPGRSPFTL